MSDELVIEKERKFLSNPGERFRPVYTPEIKSDGQIELVQTGVEDLQQYIDSFKDSCDVSLMVQRFLAGDETALRNGNPVFMDLLGAPKNLAEAYALNFRAEEAFSNLPADIKNQFGNNYFQFLSEAGSEKWYAALKKTAPEVKEEISDAE